MHFWQSHFRLHTATDTRQETLTDIQMEGLRKIATLLILVATLHVAVSHMMMDPRTGLHIPEKILGVIDIVHNHKNKPGQPQPAQNQYQPGQNYQYPQYWNQPGNYQGQAQYQGQYQGQQGQQQNQAQIQNQGQYYPNQGTSYPQNNAPVYQPTYPQYPVQNGGQSQAQGQYQYPNGGQYQGQNQQGNGQYQGQIQQQNGFQAGQVYPSQVGQFQGQNQIQGQNQGQGQNLVQGQYGGQEVNGQFQAVQSTGGQTSGFQVTGGQGTQGPACVCQAWTKPNGTKGEVGPLEKTENTEVNEVPVRM